jgi:cysteine desulfurase/selenocysteine lyase
VCQLLHIAEIRTAFPALHQNVFNKPLVYLDNAATTQKPWPVINRIKQYYEFENCNIHRGVHYLSQQATEAFEHSRRTIAAQLNATASHEIIFTKGTTDSINLVASSLGRLLLNGGDSMLITGMEHHSNLVPWQQICEQKEAKLMVVPITDKGEIDLEQYQKLLEKNPKIVAITHISNALGTVNPIKEMVRMAHVYDIPVLVDGAQSVAHTRIDLLDLDCDFFVFSGHKVYGPMGVGVLYGKEKWLERMPPYQFGGEMVDQVGFDKTTFNKLPFKFEAGTPNVGAVLGLETALQFLEETGYDAVSVHENILLNEATAKLSEIDGMRFIGEASDKAAVISFLVGAIHPYDMGTLLDKMGFAVRTGHHCAQPVMDRYDIPGTVRVSFAMYNTLEEVNRLVEAVRKATLMLT